MIFIKSKFVFLIIFFLVFIRCFSQIDSNTILTFDFNEQLFKEKDNKINIKPVGISLIDDRFGNKESAIYLHGNPWSYLNLGTSILLKPKTGTISIWINLEGYISAGKGSKVNPIIGTKNSNNEDFNCAYGLYLIEGNSRIGVVAAKDSTMSSDLVSKDSIIFNR